MNTDHLNPVQGDALRLTDGTTARVLRERYDENHAPDLAGKWQVTGPTGARVVGAEQIVGYAEDDETAAAAHARVELPGADADHVLANVLNAALQWHQAHEHGDGTMAANAAITSAEDQLHAATRTYLPRIGK
jgi:hypothetical protein